MATQARRGLLPYPHVICKGVHVLVGLPASALHTHLLATEGVPGIQEVVQWCQHLLLQQLAGIRDKPAAACRCGIYKNWPVHEQVLIDVTRVDELLQLGRSYQGHLIVGAAVTQTRLIDYLLEASEHANMACSEPNGALHGEAAVWQPFAKHMERIAGTQVRGHQVPISLLPAALCYLNACTGSGLGHLWGPSAEAAAAHFCCALHLLRVGHGLASACRSGLRQPLGEIWCWLSRWVWSLTSPPCSWLRAHRLGSCHARQGTSGQAQGSPRPLQAAVPMQDCRLQQLAYHPCSLLVAGNSCSWTPTQMAVCGHQDLLLEAD